ncbi:MAG: peptide chain release factor N(5)-glutamine methyltransferase [Pseudohongiellaceae bacterium]
MAVSIASALAEQAQQLAAVSDSGRLDAELLLADVLDKRREYLLSHGEQELDQTTIAQFSQALARRKQGEPIAYILGRKGFWDFELTVTPAVLIPRPETELLVEAALELTAATANQVLNIADLGTGSGALAIALARANPQWQVAAVDSSAEALSVARANARRLGAEHIEFFQGSWCEPLIKREYTIIVANPPYVAGDDSHLMRDGLTFEPHQALVADREGLADLEAIIRQAPHYLKRDSWLLLEHGFQQGAAVAELLRAAGYRDIHCRQDYAGQDRMTQACWPGTGESENSRSQP